MRAHHGFTLCRLIIFVLVLTAFLIILNIVCWGEFDQFLSTALILQTALLVISLSVIIIDSATEERLLQDLLSECQ